MGSGSQAPGTLARAGENGNRNETGSGITDSAWASGLCLLLAISNPPSAHKPYSKDHFSGGRPDFDDALSTIRLRDESKRCFIALFNEIKQ